MNTAVIGAASGAGSEEILTLGSVLGFFSRRRALLFWPATALVLAALMSSFWAPRRYQATTEIQVQKEDGGLFGLANTVAGQGSSGSASDSFDYNLTLQTEAGILQSPALALKVIERAHLEQTADYFGREAQRERTAARRSTELQFWRKPLEPLSLPLTQAPNRRYAAEKIFKAHLKVQPVAGTRLLEISYTDRDPARAARVANAIADVLGEMVFQQRFTATIRGSSWLSSQLDDLRAHTEQAQARAAALQRGTGVFGEDASRNVVLERLDSLNQSLTAAEANRILKEGIDKVAASASPELISSLSGNSSTGSVASINTSLSLIQGLRAQEAQVRSELGEDSVRYGPAYPKIAELRAQLAGLSKAIAEEDVRLGERAHTDLLVAQRQEDAARRAFEAQKQLATRQNDSVIAYQLARQEALSSRDLYEGLLAKLKQSSLLEGLRANNISVVSPAQTPAPAHPSSPNLPLRTAVALAAGLFLGLTAAIWAEIRDDSLRSPEQLEKWLGVPLLAVLPSVQRPARSFLPGRKQHLRIEAESGRERAVLSSPREAMPLAALTPESTAFGEQLRLLRAALQLSCHGAPPQVILVTSCLPGEGKTTIALNLAAVFAKNGARVLLVDADLRKPKLHAYGIGEGGLAMALSGPEPVKPQTALAAIPGFDMLAGTEVPHSPTEMLGSPRMRELVDEWRANYDHIILDSPPVLPVADALLLSTYSDATLLVARQRQTPSQALRRGFEALQMPSKAHAPIAVVLNDVARGSGQMHAYYDYRKGAYAG